MSLVEIRKAYKNCLSLRYKKRKTIPYKDLDTCLYIVEKYVCLAEQIEKDTE